MQALFQKQMESVHYEKFLNDFLKVCNQNKLLFAFYIPANFWSILRFA